MVKVDLMRYFKKGLKIGKYPTADRNASLTGLMLNAVPYFISKGGYGRPPLSVFIHVNNKCNLKCKMCDAGQDVPTSNFYKNLKGACNSDMTIDSFKQIIDKVKHFKPFIGIPALEPLLYPHVTEAITYVREQGLRMSLATNGTLLEDMAEKLVKAGLTKIVVSVDGTEDIHDKIRGVKGTYRQVMKGINRIEQVKRRLNKMEPYIFINYAIFDDNHMILKQFMDSLPLNAIRRVNFRVMFYCPEELAVKHNKDFGDKYKATATCLAGGIDLSKVDTDLLYDEILKSRKAYPGKSKLFFHHGRAGLNTYYHDAETFLDKTRCVFPWYTMQVDQDGNVIAPQRCYHNIFGNIFSQEFEDIWNGDKMREFRRDLRKHGRFPACARCEGVNF